MFENLSERLSGVFGKLTKQGTLSENDVKTALREVRIALLEADVSLPVARDFVAAVQEKAQGQNVTKSITPGQQVIKIVHDELKYFLAGILNFQNGINIINTSPILKDAIKIGGTELFRASFATGNALP